MKSISSHEKESNDGDEMSALDALQQLDLMRSANVESSSDMDKRITIADNTTNTIEERVIEEIKNLVLDVLKLKEDEFSLTTPLMDYGLDSIASTEIGNLFTERFDITIPPTVFFEFQDLRSFVGYLMNNHLDQIKVLFPESTPSDQRNSRLSVEELVDYNQIDSVADKSTDHEVIHDIQSQLNNLSINTENHNQKYSKFDSSTNLLTIEELWSEEANNHKHGGIGAIKQPSRSFLEARKGNITKAFTHTITSKDKRPLEYASYGEGPPLLMLGGLLMNYSVMWLTNFEELAKKHELIMFHMPGCGNLPLHGNLSMLTITEDIAEVLNAHGISEPIPVFGTSFGGVMAQSFAIHYPSRCSALAIAVSTPLAEGATDFQQLMRELQVSPNFMELNRSWPMASLPAYEKVIEGFDFREDLKELTIPTLVVAGGVDKYTRVEHSKMIADSLPNSELHVFPDAGHLLTFSHYEEFNDLLISFLENSINNAQTPPKKPQLSVENRLDLITNKNIISRSTLGHANEYVRSGSQGHCVMLSDHAAQAARILRELIIQNKINGVDYRSYFLTCVEEALDASIRLSRHYARNRDSGSQGQILIIDSGEYWQNYFDPLGNGPEASLVPGIHFYHSWLHAADRIHFDDYVAVVVVADESTDTRELFEYSAMLEQMKPMSILVNSLSANKQDWIARQTKGVFDIVVLGEEVSGFQTPVATMMIEKGISNPWLMTPSEGYVRQPMANLGLTLKLTYEHCREFFHSRLSGDLLQELNRYHYDQKSVKTAHVKYGNIGYAKVAAMHGYDRKFINGYGVKSTLIDSNDETNNIIEYQAIDCLSNVGNAMRGLNPPDLIENVFNVHNSETDYWQLLSIKLHELTGFTECIPAASQTIAIEKAISLLLLNNPKKNKILCFSGGAGFSLISANTAKDEVFDLFRKPFEPLYPGTLFIDPNENDARSLLVEALSRNDLAAVWFETYQVEGNAIRPLPDEFIELISQHKKSNGYLVGIDETQTNLITGQFLHSQKFDIKADVIAIATALADSVSPVGAVLCDQEFVTHLKSNNSIIYDSLKNRHRNQLVAQVALNSLVSIYDQNLIPEINKKGHYLKNGLQKLCDKYPLLKEVRGEGLLLGIELDLVKYSAFITQSFGYFLWGAMMRDKEEGLLVVVCPIHNNCLRIMPPLTISIKECDGIIKNIERRLEEGVEGVLKNCASYLRSRGEQRMADFLLKNLEQTA